MLYIFFISFSIPFTSTSFQIDYHNTHIHLLFTPKEKKVYVEISWNSFAPNLKPKTDEFYSIFFSFILNKIIPTEYLISQIKLSFPIIVIII